MMASPTFVKSSLQRSPARTGWFAGISAFVILWSAFCIWVHRSYEGYYHGPLLISAKFGVPESLPAELFSPVYIDESGWDGQFFYWMSTDPWIVDPTVGPHMDSPDYRYQRIGIAIVVWAAAKVLGEDYPSPRSYFLVINLIVALGVGVLAGYLRSRGRSPWLVLPWVCSAGVAFSSWHGLPDTVADVWFLLSFIALVSRRWVLYAAFATLLLLTREGFAPFAAFVWLGLLVRRLRDGRSAASFSTLVLTMIPGIVVLTWAAYVAHQFDLRTIMQSSRSIPWGELTDYPFRAAIECILGRSDRPPAPADLLVRVRLVICTFTLAATIFAVVRYRRILPASGAILAWLILVSMTGKIIWETPAGYLKSVTGPVLILILVQSIRPSAFILAVLLVNLAMGIEFFVRDAVFISQSLSPNRLASPAPPVVASDAPRTIPRLNEFHGRIELLEDRTLEYEGMWKFAHIPIRHYRIRLTNTSGAVWQWGMSPRDKCPVMLAADFRNAKDHKVFSTRHELFTDIPPGESRELTLRIPARPGLRRTKLRLSLLQEEQMWFPDPEASIDIP